MRRRRSRDLQRWTRERLKVRVAAVSSSLADHAAEGLGLPRRQINVIPNGFATDRFRFEERRPKEEIVVCVLGRLIPAKGPWQALEAFAILRERLPAARLWFIGDGPMRQELVAKVAESGLSELVTFWGMLPRPEARLRETDVLWMPSESEGMPLACIEAMACGIPVLGYDVRGVRDLLQDGCGILVTPKDSRGLAEQTARLVEDSDGYRALALKARLRVEKHYSLQRMCADHYGLMRSLCGQKKMATGAVGARSAESHAGGARE